MLDYNYEYYLTMAKNDTSIFLGILANKNKVDEVIFKGSDPIPPALPPDDITVQSAQEYSMIYFRWWADPNVNNFIICDNTSNPITHVNQMIPMDVNNFSLKDYAVNGKIYAFYRKEILIEDENGQSATGEVMTQPISEQEMINNWNGIKNPAGKWNSIIDLKVFKNMKMNEIYKGER